MDGASASVNDEAPRDEVPRGSETELISRNLCAIVDIGTNGIRFSISSKSQHHARIMPCVFKDRLGISLYELQFPPGGAIAAAAAAGAGAGGRLAPPLPHQIPIPDDIILEICNAMKRFKLICEDFGVSDESVTVVATEATRVALNKDQFVSAIAESTGWSVDVLSPEQETQITTYGLVSSFNAINGLFLDLSGGSVQLSWVKSSAGKVDYCPHPINLPYGASVLARRVSSEGKAPLYTEIRDALVREINNPAFEIPQEMILEAQRRGGFDLFTRGGGLRGLGHLLLSQDKTYPIQTIINGVAIPYDEFVAMTDYLFLRGHIPLPLGRKSGNNKIFKVSEKRAWQLPGVAVLMTALFECLPKIKSIYFSEGGIREGTLYSYLPRGLCSQDPLVTASAPYAPLLTEKYYQLLLTAIPQNEVPEIVWQRVAPALCNLAFIHASYPKELQPTAALHVATTGIIAGCHGLSHRVRALIGIALCNRWGGNIPENEELFLNSLEQLILNDTDKTRVRKILWWTKYIGTIMYVICGVHPGGNIRDNVFDFQVITHRRDSSSLAKKTRELLIDEALTAAQPPQHTEFEVLVNIGKDDLKTSASVRARIITLQKKIRKLSRGNVERVAVRVHMREDEA
ncbi:Rtg2p KNAG_0D03010 [Huiozyma naganishii CBS 8797]|uniref:Uncharacterized protein n=1 Tax=Huiozyma naganishii (strain ATCC MYA-139 / BCRC 22969 / CBS 8797 / KCTC 17520 / NBRC 10181 / NCYC 3082 / Yp74L-3) TaxID=1071383 RepID=J7R5D5_HUIN7|nr:hypothetical protein KNAG_0D03010 [Kazachstania naganishii CBS 8797]CCK70050.1 hypothetical protein KNAG_0D03010 [Kazachstania naganishii CBS 8797]